MITIKNNSAETLELVSHLDATVEGCRVLGTTPPMQFKSGGEITMLGYEPGISYTIRPVEDPELPRTSSMIPGAYPRVRP